MNRIKQLFIAAQIKYKQAGDPLKASFWFLICGFFQKGISFLTTPFFTRIMNSAQYGVYNQYYAWYSIIQILVTLNLAAGVYTRGLVKNEDDQDAFSSSLLLLSTVCVALGVCIYCLFKNSINSLTGLNVIFMLLMFIEIWTNVSFLFWSNKERVNYRYKKLVALTLIYVISRPVMGMVLVIFARPDKQALARVLGAVIVNAVLYIPLFVRIVYKGKVLFNYNYWKYAVFFNIPLVPHYLSQVLLNQSDRIMITKICGSSETAYYSVAYTLAMVMQIFSQSITSTMNPWIYKTIKRGQIKRIENASYIILVAVAAVNLILILFSPELLLILAPEDYQRAVWIIPPVTISVFFMFLYNLFVTFEYYYEKTKFVPIATGISALLNIILNYIFIPRFGYVAAGYTTLICYIIYAIAHYVFMNKMMAGVTGDNRVYNTNIIITISVLLIASGLIISMFYDKIIIRYSIAAVSVFLVLINYKRIYKFIRMRIDNEKV